MGSWERGKTIEKGSVVMVNFTIITKKCYLRILQWLCRMELRKIADKYPATRGELIKYHEFMAIECVNAETKTKERILGISIGTANMLEGKGR
jgi:hypothetical protein